jgi:Cell division protein 48 (CDC48), N-terminal domain
MSQQQVQLKVVESYTRDVGRGEARLDYVTMDALGASTGDVIEIKGKRRTVAKCLPLPYEHFQEAAKKVRSSRESNPMEKVSAPYYR